MDTVVYENLGKHRGQSKGAPGGSERGRELGKRGGSGAGCGLTAGRAAIRDATKVQLKLTERENWFWPGRPWLSPTPTSWKGRCRPYGKVK